MNDAHRVADDLAFAVKVFSNPVDDVLTEVGSELKGDVGDAVQFDIGDQSMSNWRRGNPIVIAGRYDVKGESVVIAPERKALGPMRVLSDGRKAYAAGDLRKSGSRIRKRTGERVDKTRRVARTVGATRGKGTWVDAEQLMERHAADAVERAAIRVAKKARLPGG